LFAGLNLTHARFYFTGPEAAAQPNLLNWATDYVRWRALSMPTSLLLGVLQASLLGAKDSVTPLVAVGWSMVINILGDYLLVSVFGMGLRGAAIATTLAQWGATLALIGPARKKLVKDHDLGLVSNKHKKIDVPNRTTSKAFLIFAGPVLTLILGKLAAFGFMTNAAAGLPGQPTTLASHQIILSTFFFISPFLEVISQTAQTFLPSYIAPIKEYIDTMLKKDPAYNSDDDPVVQPWEAASFKVASRLMGIGLVVASFVATLVSAIPAMFPQIITSDPIVQTIVKPLAKYLWAGAFLTAPVAVSEGVLLAKRELPFLATVYLVSSIVLPFALIQIKRAGAPVAQVWGCFAAFQLFRATMFAGKIWGGALVHKTKKVFSGTKGMKMKTVGL
jgi:Na+-driven multidrug efflux pump